MKTVLFADVLSAARDTASKLAGRDVHGQPCAFTVDANGGHTACIRPGPYRGLFVLSLPSLPPDARLTVVEARTMTAYLLHEIGHARLTDFNLSSTDPALQSILNGIEDVWMERDLGDRCQFGGAMSLFSEHFADTWAKDRLRGWAAQGMTARDVAVSIAYLGRAVTVPEMAQSDAATILAGMPKAITRAVRMALDALPGITSTAEARLLAQRVLRTLTTDKAKAEAEAAKKAEAEAAKKAEAEAKKPKPAPKAEAKDDKGQGEDSEAEAEEGEGQGEDSEAEAEEGEGQSEGEGQDSDAEDGKGKGKGKGEGEDSDAEEGEGEGQGKDSEGEGKGQGEGKGEGEGEGEGQSEAEAEGEGQGEGKGEGKSEGQSKSDAPADGPGGGRGSNAPVAATEDAMAEVAKAAADRMGQPMSPAAMAAAGAISSLWKGCPSVPWGVTPVGRDTPGERERHTILGNLANAGGSAILRDTVTRLLRARDRIGMDRYLTHGRLDRRALGRVMIGASNTQARRTFVPGQDTAVCLLLDSTGSMARADNGRTMEPVGVDKTGIVVNRAMIANGMATTLGRAVEAAGADLMIATFLGNTGEINRIVREKNTISTPELMGSGYLGIIKPWSGRMVQAETLLAAFKSAGGTLLAPGILGAADHLRTRRVDRRLIIALTDGQCQAGVAAVAEASRMAERGGCEVLGIVLGPELSDAQASGMFSDWFRAVTVADLNAKTLGAVGKRLEEALKRPEEARKRRRARMTGLTTPTA